MVFDKFISMMAFINLVQRTMLLSPMSHLMEFLPTQTCNLLFSESFTASIFNENKVLPGGSLPTNHEILLMLKFVFPTKLDNILGNDSADVIYCSHTSDTIVHRNVLINPESDTSLLGILAFYVCLSHWGRVTHICVGKLTIIGSDNGLTPGRRQAIIWTNAGILLIGPLGTNFSEILIGNSNIFNQGNAVENVVCKKAAILSRPQWVKTLGLTKWLIFCNMHSYAFSWVKIIVFYSIFKFVLKCLFDNKSALVRVMAWHWIGDKPLLGEMLTYINGLQPAYTAKFIEDIQTIITWISSGNQPIHSGNRLWPPLLTWFNFNPSMHK